MRMSSWAGGFEGSMVTTVALTLLSPPWPAENSLLEIVTVMPGVIPGFFAPSTDATVQVPMGMCGAFSVSVGADGEPQPAQAMVRSKQPAGRRVMGATSIGNRGQG